MKNEDLWSPVPKNPLQVLTEILERCEPEDAAPITWGALRRQVGQAAREWEALS